MNLRADGWGGSSARARPRADQQWRRGRATVTRGRATGRGGGAARRTRWGGWPGEEAAAPDATGSAARMRGSGGTAGSGTRRHHGRERTRASMRPVRTPFFSPYWATGFSNEIKTCVPKFVQYISPEIGKFSSDSCIPGKRDWHHFCV